MFSISLFRFQYDKDTQPPASLQGIEFTLRQLVVARQLPTLQYLPLLSLNLTGNSVDSVGGSIITAALRDGGPLCRLRSLSILDNPIGVEAASQLAKVFLHRLDLAVDNIRSPAAEAVDWDIGTACSEEWAVFMSTIARGISFSKVRNVTCRLISTFAVPCASWTDILQVYVPGICLPSGYLSPIFNSLIV